MADRAELEELRRLDELERRAAGRAVAATQPKDSPEPNYDPTTDMSAAQKLGAGYVSGLNKGLRGTVNLLTSGKIPILDPLGTAARLTGNPEMFTPDFAKSERLAELEQQDKALGDTGWGFTGQLAGEIAATAPAGGVRVGVEKLASNAPRVLSRALGAGAEGAVASQMLNPGDTAESAQSAGVSSALSLAGSGAGRVMKGIVRKSPEAQRMEDLADAHGTQLDLPLAQSASDEGVSGIARKFYSDILPSVPGAQRSSRKQNELAQAQMRELALKESAPTGLGSTQPGFANSLPLSSRKQAGAGTKVHESIRGIGDAFEKEYADTIRSYAFNTPKPGDAASYLTKQNPNIDPTTLQEVSGVLDGLLQRYSRKGVLNGEDLILAKTQLAQLGRQAGDIRTGQTYAAAQEYLDGLVRAELMQGGKKQNLTDLQRYEALSEPWKNFQRTQDAVARTKNPGGQFTAQDLQGAVKAQGSTRQLARGEAPMQELSEAALTTVGRPARNPGWAEKLATWALLGGSSVFTPAGAGILAGGANMLARPTTQDALMGQTKLQKAVVDAVRKNPKVREAASSLRRGLSVQEEDNEQE